MQADTAVDQQSGPFQHRASGFLRHPDIYPHELRPLPPWQQWRQQKRPCRGMGIVCHSRRHLSPGTWAELTIPVRDQQECFAGRVVMVRETSDGYDVGLCLESEDDGARLRIVEQYCHMECYCRNVDDDVPKNGHEATARAWVERFAATFPSL